MTQPSTNLFRQEALEHYLEAEEGRGLVRVSPPWSWALLWVVLSSLAVAVVMSFLGRVEINGRSRGILRPSGGVRILTSQVGGTIARVEVHSGQWVKAGTVLLAIDAPAVQGQLLEAERQMQAVRTDFQAISSKQERHHQEQSQSLRDRIQKLKQQVASNQASVVLFERRLKANLTLEKQGLVSSIEADSAREALAQAQRQLGGSQQNLDQTQQELASLEGRRQDELWQRQQVLSGAQNKRDALAFTLGQTVLRAPEDGLVEAILVRPGESIQPAQALGKVIPQGSALQGVSFLAEKDRAFVKPGDQVHVELDQLPYGEFGTVRAKVIRISDDLASPAEIREALGEDQKLDSPTYRVELQITDDRAATSAGVKLRTGMQANMRYTLRRERLATLVLAPLRRWFR